MNAEELKKLMETILAELRTVEVEPDSLHKGEDWISGLCRAEEIVMSNFKRCVKSLR